VRVGATHQGLTGGVIVTYQKKKKKKKKNQIKTGPEVFVSLFVPFSVRGSRSFRCQYPPPSPSSLCSSGPLYLRQLGQTPSPVLLAERTNSGLARSGSPSFRPQKWAQFSTILSLNALSNRISTFLTSAVRLSQKRPAWPDLATASSPSPPNSSSPDTTLSSFHHPVNVSQHVQGICSEARPCLHGHHRA
jgi:hypothetical protein